MLCMNIGIKILQTSVHSSKIVGEQSSEMRKKKRRGERKNV